MTNGLIFLCRNDKEKEDVQQWQWSPAPREVPDKKQRKNTKRKVRSLQRLVPGRPVPVNHHPHQGSPRVKGMCSLNFWISLFLSYRFFSLPSCISVIPLPITNILILVFPPFSSDQSPLLTRQKVMKLTYRTLLCWVRDLHQAQEEGEALQRHHTVSICP